jgi:hypothetical protein
MCGFGTLVVARSFNNRPFFEFFCSARKLLVFATVSVPKSMIRKGRVWRKGVGMVARVSEERVEVEERKGSLLRDVSIFLAGVGTIQTLALVWISVIGLPTSIPQFASITATQNVNVLAILTALATMGLLYGANNLKNRSVKIRLKRMGVRCANDSTSRPVPPIWTTPESLSRSHLSGRPGPRDFYWRRRV